MLRSLGLFGLIILHSVLAGTTQISSVTCPTDWSVDPIDDVLRCMSPQAATPVRCEVSSCTNFPVCSKCTNVSSEETKDQVTCKKGYNIIDNVEGSYIICIDEDQNQFSCKKHSSAILTCHDCTFDTTPFKVQIQKRAILNGGCGGEHGTKGFGGGLDW